MDPLRLIGIVQDGDFSRVRQLVQDNLPLSPNAPEPTETYEERMERRVQDHPWKSPIARYRMKQQLANGTEYDEDKDLEELSWKHRSKAYDLTRSDITSKRVYHSEEYENYNSIMPSHYTNRRPKSIETDLAPKPFDEEVITPATAPMDEDEFDSPYSSSTPTRVTLIDSSPSAVTPPKEILDQIAIDNKQKSEVETEGTEVTLEMFQDDAFFQGIRENIQKERSPKNLDTAVKEMLERKSGVKQLIQEHERLMAETQRTVAVSPESFAKSQSRTRRKIKMDSKDEIESPFDEQAASDSGSVTTMLYGENILDTSTRETMTQDDNKIHVDKSTIVFDDVNEDEAYLPRSSVLTTIMEESTPLKISSPLTLSPDKNSDVVDAFSRVQALTIDTSKQLTYTREEFKKSRIRPLNKVTIAAALIEFNNILMEESNAFDGEKMTNDSRLFKAIMKHRRQNGFFTSTTPTHESLKNGAATVIQAFWRTVLAIRHAERKVENARNFAASMIQAQWRAHDCRMTYKWHRGSAIVVQAQWKSYSLRKQFKSLRSSAIRVQSISRMKQCQSKFLHQKSAVIALQTTWRSCHCEKQYHMLRSSALVVQSITRMHQQRKKYLKKRNSAIALQNFWRSSNSQNQYQSLRASAIKIQSIVRMHKRQMAYLDFKSSSQIVQNKWRSYIVRKKYDTMRSSAILVQSIVRMHQNQKNYCEKKVSAILLQTKWRSLASQRQYGSMRSSSLLLQSLARMQQQRAKFHKLKACTISIQAAMRMYFCRKKYMECRNAVTTLQSAQRMNVCRSKYAQSIEAAILLQSLTRMRRSRSMYLDQKAASTTLQASWRMFQCRSTFALSVKSASIIQAKTRAVLRRTMYLKQQQAAIKLQGAMRMHLARDNYLLKKSAALVIQDTIREFLLQKDHATIETMRKVHAKWRSSAFVSDYSALIEIKSIPTSPRTFIYKRNIMHRLSSSIIQSNWRKFVQRKRVEAAGQIQGRWRAFKCRQTYLATLGSVRLLQSRCRTYIQRRNHLRAIHSAIKIESLWRAHSCKKDYHRTLASVTTLQAAFRTYACRKNYTFLVSNATKLESAARMYLCRGRFIQHKASRTIQAAARMYLCRNQLDMLICCKAATMIQSVFRSYSCRKELQLYATQIDEVDHGYIDYENEGTFLSRSSILTTIAEERASLLFASPPLEAPKTLSDLDEDESEEEILPSTIKKQRIDNLTEDNSQSFDDISQDQVQIESNDDSVLPVGEKQELESRRTSEERLRALAAKVAAKRRASLDMNKKESTTRNPWQERKESEKRSKTVSLSKRMGELERLANRKKVSTSRWNESEEQNQAIDVSDQGPFGRYQKNNRGDENQGINKNDPVVKKLFEPGSFEDLPPNDMDASKPISEIEIPVIHEVDDVDNGRSAAELDENDVSFDHPKIENQSLEKEVTDDIECFDSDDELKPAIGAWKRQSIVDDLADDIFAYDSMSDSDSDDELRSLDQHPEPKSVSNRTNGNRTEVSDLDKNRAREKEDSPRSVWELSVVDDLIDDEVELLDSEDDDDFEETRTDKKDGVHLKSPVALSKIRKEHPLWRITREDVSESISSSLYTVAGVAASLIGLGE